MKKNVALLIVSLGLGGCSKTAVISAADKEAANEIPVTVVEHVADRNLINIEKPERFATAVAASRSESDQILANGTVAADVSRTYPVNSLSSGRVIDVRVRLGDDVKAGQLMLTMTSPEMAIGISDFQKFTAAEALAKIQLDRMQLLLSHGAAPQKDVEIAEDTYRRAKIDTATAAEHIRILGGDAQHLSPVIEIHAPVSGTIIEQNVTSAAGIKSLDNSPNLFTIADLSSIWILCDVYENDLMHVHVGDQTTLEFSAYPGRTFKGRVTNISKLLDANTRSAKVRIELPNESGMLRPNMFVTAHFISQGATVRTVVPSTAVLRLQDRDWIFVKVGEKQFRRTEVQAGPVNPDGTQQVLSGIKPGDLVVTEALMFDREVQTSQQ